MGVKAVQWRLLLAAGVILTIGCQVSSQRKDGRASPGNCILHAHFYDSGFRHGDDNYNACFRAGNGRIYYVLASMSVEKGAQMFAFDPKTGKIDHAADLTAAAGESGLHAIPQGKGHSIFVEHGDKLYFATHIGYYDPSTAAGQEVAGTPPPGYKRYPGGHFLSYDLNTGQTEDLAKAPEGEGILAFNMDPQRGRLYGITWPSGLFLRYDLRTHALRNLGPISQGSEKGVPEKTFEVICRCLAIEPDDGSVYFTTADGTIFQYRYDLDSIAKVRECNLRRDVFGCLDPRKPGTMGYNWRQAVWYAPQKVFYAVHGRSEYLFSFDPRMRKVEVVRRLVSDATRQSGMYDRFSYGYLGFVLGPDEHTIYYLTGAPRTPHEAAQPATELPGRKVEQEDIGKDDATQKLIDETSPSDRDEDIHLVTYDILSGRCVDHGGLQLDSGIRPFFAQSIAVGGSTIYTVAKIRNSGGHVRVDLLGFPNPLQ